MTALTAPRNTPAMDAFRAVVRDVAPDTVVYAGSLAAQTAAGLAVPASATATLTVLGRARHTVSTIGGGAGEVVIDRGVYRWDNLGADPVTIADYGKTCYAADDQTVARTNGSNTRPVAGTVRDVDGQGVWVET